MKNLTSALVLIALFSGLSLASDRGTGRATQPTNPPRAAPANGYLQARNAVLERDKQTVKNAFIYLTAPQPWLLDIVLQQIAANNNLTAFLSTSPELRAARTEMHRFWMNNQPAVLTYERLNGAIGP